MGSGASQNLEEAQKVVRDLESVIACTSLLMGLNPRHIRFPDMYSIFDFELKNEEEENEFASDALLELKRELQLATTKEYEMGKQKEDDNDTPKKQNGNSDNNNNNDDIGDSGKEDDTADGIFVFKGTISPSAEVKDKRKREKKQAIEPAFVVAVQNSGIIKLRTLNDQNEDGWTPLHACCHAADMFEAAKALINAIRRKGLSIDLQTTKGPGAFASGYTPLHVAAAYGIYDTAKELVEAGANINTRNSLDQTPLHEVCYRGYTEIAHLLIDASKNLNVECPSGNANPIHPLTPLAKSSRYGHGRIVKILLAAGASIDYQESETGWTALMEAAYFFHDDIVRLLLIHGASPDLLSKEGYSAKEVCSSKSICEMLDDYDNFRREYKMENDCDEKAVDNSTMGAKWMTSSGAQKLLKKEKEKKSRNIFSLDWDEDDYRDSDDDIFEGIINSNVDIFRDSTYHINGNNDSSSIKIRRIHEDENEIDLPTYRELEDDVNSSEGQKMKTTTDQNANLVGGTNKSDHRLLGDLPSLHVSMHGNRRIQNMRDEEEIEKWRKKRKQELIERAAKIAAKKKQKEKRRERRQYKEAIANSDTVPAEFICPLTMKLMKHPVATPYNQTYEAAAIIEYIHDYQNRCPKTGQPLSKVDLKEDKRLVKKIMKWKKEFKKEFKLKSVSPPKGTSTKDTTTDGDVDKYKLADDVNNDTSKKKNANSKKKKKSPVCVIKKDVNSPKNETEILESSREIKFHSSPTNKESKYNDDINKFKTTHFKHVVDNENEEDDDEYDFE